jgi:glucokinase
VILAGDVGGTKTLLALLDAQGTLVREAALPSHEFAAFEDALRRFLADGPRQPIAAACFGVAGAVVDGRSVTTNLPWVVDEAVLARAIPTPRVQLLNDLEATAHGVLALGPADFETLQAGMERPGNMAVIAAGTGLGEALIVRDGSRHVVVASEGGHGDFGPRGETQIELLRFLAREFGHVSRERVLSGPGLVNIYRFLRARDGGSEPAWLAARLATEDPSAVISEVALANGHPTCVEALDLFVAIYGGEAGNVALEGLAVAGVFVAGGIAPKIRARLVSGVFVTAFRDKGRLADLMARIPVHVVLELRAGLIGASRVAATMVA